MPAENNFRLPETLSPLRYSITLTPDLQAFTFAGEETVELDVRSATDKIIVHALELTMSAASVELADGSVLQATGINLDEAIEIATMTFDRPIPVGKASLRLQFAGTLNDHLRGFYRSRYLLDDGTERYMGTTQFEATDARRAFPCWDEPSFKAVFQVNLVIPDDLVALCNTPVTEERSTGNGTKLVRFADSPKMSTYLVAFVIGDLAHVEATAPNGTRVRVWATRGKEEQGRLALENAIRILEFFNGYFGIPYPLPKLDHIAIPDFASGAMENWGLITYRETVLLYDPASSAASTRQRIVEVIAHEMAHMWFGDLVTMEWWDDLWLNESFASWIGDKAVDALYPEWDMWAQFVSHDTNSGLGLDGLRNSHPIEVPVSDPNQIREIFDAITYSKGASLLRMLEDYIGADTFLKGLQAYISKHKYANARGADLWSALAEASGQPVAEMMDTWIKQTGYPVVQATANDNLGLVHLTQRRFIYEYIHGGPQDDPTLWRVPVHITQQGTSEQTNALMTDRDLDVPLPVPMKDARWTKINAGQTGFYRVQYEEQELEKLRMAVERKELSTSDRLSLQNDAYALARAGFAPATLFLQLASSYHDETDAIVWGDLASNIGGIENLILNEPFLTQFDDFSRTLFRAVVKKIGWDPQPNEGHLETLLRSMILGAAGGYGDAEVIAEANRRFQDLVANPASVDPNLRGVVIALTAEHGDEALFDLLLNLAHKATLQEEKLRYLRSLGRFPQEELMQRALEIALDPEEVRVQDTVSVLGSVAGNRHQGRELTWDFVKDNWPEIDRRYGRGGGGISSIVGMTGGFTSPDKSVEVERFFADHPVPSAARGIQQSLERIRLNVAWLEQNRERVSAWFASRG